MNKENSDLFRGILLAHLIIFLHLLLIAGLGLLVLFFYGISQYTGFLSICSGFFWGHPSFLPVADFSFTGTFETEEHKRL